MDIIPRDQLGVFIQRQDPDTQVLYADGFWRPIIASGGTVTSVALAAPSADFTVSGSPVTTSGTLTLTWKNQNPNIFLAGPATGPAATPGFRAIVPADLAGTPGAGKYWDGGGAGAWTTLPPPGTGTVTSVQVAVPAELNSAGGPITTSGTITLTWVNETANFVFAGPTTGVPAVPTFRALVAADIPALSYVSSVALSAPTAEFTVSGSPVTSTGTLTFVWKNQNANLVFAGPSTGSPATPAFRSLVAADLPAGTGTVTSVNLTAPSEITVGGVPITTSGTIALTWATQNNNLFFSGPNSGGPLTPTFRTIKAEDIGTGTPTTGYATLSTGAGNRPAWGPLGAPAIGYTSGRDMDLPAAGAFTFYNASSDTRQLYTSDGTNIRNFNGNNPGTSIGLAVGGFDASNYLVTAQGASNGPAFTNPYTLIFCFLVNTLPGTGGGTIACFHPGTSITAGWLFAGSVTNSNKMRMFLAGVTGSELTGITLTTGVHCFAINYNGSAMRYCMDGGAVSSVATTGSYTAPNASSAAFIGRFGGSGSVNNYADFGFMIGYASALSDGDMQAITASPSTYRPAAISGTIAYYWHSSWMGNGGFGSGGRAVNAIGTGVLGTTAFFVQGQTGLFIAQR